MTALGNNPPTTPTLPVAKGGVSNRITPPGTACRILPLFSPPGCHFYDSYSNCFQHRPEVRAKLRDAARRYEAHRLAVLHAEDPHGSHLCGGAALRDDRGFPADAWKSYTTASAHRPLPLPCRCALKATQLFATHDDVPQPALPLSKCELHEVLLSLPPRWQNYPWRLCFDTARDGFSLSTLYRCMESVEEMQTRAKTVAFGLFFVHTREDAPAQPVAVAYPSAASTPTTAAAGASTSSPYTSPVTAGAGKSFLAAHRSSSLRYGAARGTLPFSVVGCFTPEVPSLAHHAANIYFGSTETTVFRLDQLGQSTRRGEWMMSTFENEEQRQEGNVSPLDGLQDGAGRRTPGSLSASVPRTRSWNKSGGALSDHSSLHSSQGGTLKSVQGFAQMADSAEQTRVPVPMHTHMTIEHLSKVAEKAEGAAAESTTPTGASVGVASRVSSSVLTASPTSGHPPSPSHRGGTSRTFPSGHRSLRVSPVKGVVPRAPLLTKYEWAGRLDNRKFIVCNPHFFALGAGKSGAALYVDEALQFGTSSHWCETFNAPCLFGPRPAVTPSTSTPTSPSRAAVPPMASPSTPNATPAVHSSLPHCEFAISRVVWFTITEDRRTFRLMSGTGTESIATDGEANDDDDDDETRCGCGRVGRAGEMGAAVAEASETGTPVGLSYLHQCDLLPFTEQPY